MDGIQAIKAYLDLIDTQLLHHITGKPRWFIDLFREQEYLSDEAFMYRICDEKYNESYYRKLKSKTIRILQSLAVVSSPKGNSLVKKKYEICQKNFVVGQKLLAKNDRIESIRLIKEAHDIAVLYDFTHLACELAGILYHNQVYFEKRTKKGELDAEEYAKEMDKYAYNYMAEKKVEYYFYRILAHMTRSANPEPIEEAIIKLEEWQGTSIKFIVHQATLKVILSFNKGNYQQIIRDCSETLDFFKGKQGAFAAHHFSFLKDKGVAQMAVGLYADAINSFQQASEYVRNKSYNFYLLQFYETMNALRSGQYQVAYNLYQQNGKCRNENIRQQFAIIEAYLHFLVYTGHLQLDKPFRIRKYLNDTFKAQADKQGDNISILIAELLMYLAKDRDRFIDRVEAVKNYSYRYLKGEDTKRAKWFIRILCMMPRANFHPIALARLAKKQIENLEESHNQTGQNFAIEIIPFGELLSMIMKHLQRKVA